MSKRSLAGVMFFFMFVALVMVCTCDGGGGHSDGGGLGSEGEDEGEGESEQITGDDPCPREGCETSIICASDADCPNDDDPCQIYHCDLATATCRWHILDQDGDGFAPQICDGHDCNDSPDCETYLYEGEPVDGLCGDFVHPGAEEYCNGEDDNCNGEIDEHIEPGPCANNADLCGTRPCIRGEWGECAGGSGPNPEVCDNVDNDCDSEIDEGIAVAITSVKEEIKCIATCLDGNIHCECDGHYCFCDGEDNELCGICCNFNSAPFPSPP